MLGLDLVHIGVHEERRAAAEGQHEMGRHALLDERLPRLINDCKLGQQGLPIAFRDIERNLCLVESLQGGLIMRLSGATAPAPEQGNCEDEHQGTRSKASMHSALRGARALSIHDCLAWVPGDARADSCTTNTAK